MAVIYLHLRGLSGASGDHWLRHAGGGQEETQFTRGSLLDLFVFILLFLGSNFLLGVNFTRSDANIVKFEHTDDLGRRICAHLKLGVK